MVQRLGAFFSEIEKQKEAFESVQRPTLDIEVRKAKVPTKERPESSSSPHLKMHPRHSEVFSKSCSDTLFT
jgi:DICT domain-containing protein